MKKKILITFGDSFTYGLQEDIDLCLEYSFGNHVAKFLGVDYYINYSTPAWGNESAWKSFLRLNPRISFKDYDVYVIFIASYFVRMTIPFDLNYKTLSYQSNEEPFMNHWIRTEPNPLLTLEKYNIDVLKEILLTLDDWNWDWMLGFNNENDEHLFTNQYSINKRNLLPKAFKHGMYHGVPKIYHCHKTGHLTKEGYEAIGNHVINHIQRKKSHWIGNSKDNVDKCDVHITNFEIRLDSKIDFGNQSFI